MHISLTDTQFKKLCNNIVILCQSNEQKNAHILDYFDSVGIRYRQRSIRDGDYSFIVEACPELGIPCDLAFDDDLFIERKNSLQELAQSLYGQKEKKTVVVDGEKISKTDYNDAFLRELKRAINKPYKFLLVEQKGGWSDLFDKRYPNNYSVEAFSSMLTVVEERYGLHVRFVRAEDMGKHIYLICKMILKEYVNYGFTR